MLEKIRWTYTMQIIQRIIELLGDLWPYVITGIVLTSLLTVFFPADRIKAYWGQRRWISIFVISLIAVMSPLSTFTLIPLVAFLWRENVPAASLMAFLVASPLMNPTLFFITLGSIGWEMALARTSVAILLGISAGLAVEIMNRNDYLKKYLQLSQAHFTVNPKPLQTGWSAFLLALKKNSRFILKFFILGITIAAVVEIMIPPSWVYRLVGGGNRLGILLATILGVPLYTCGGGSLPMIMVLINMGMDKGAALAYLTAGPATQFSTLFTIPTAMRPAILALYLTISLLGAIVSGYIYSFF